MAKTMIAVQPVNERTPTQNIAAGSESRTVRLLCDSGVTIDVEISARGSLSIVRSLPADCAVVRSVRVQGEPGAGE